MMMYLLPILSVGFGAVAIGYHFLGIRLGLYRSQGGYWWFDETAHFLSGGAVFLLLYQLPGPEWLPWILFGVAVGGWEAWEYHHGAPEDLWHSARNMTHDLMSGGLAAAIIALLLS